MQIVLDTNIIFRTHRRLLRGPEFEALSTLIEKKEVQLVIPKLVVEELVHLFERHLRLALRATQKATDKLSGFLMEETEVGVWKGNVQREVGLYRQALEQRLQELRAVSPDFGAVSHNRLITRLNEGRKPFKSDDRGYKDALLWETILDEVVNDSALTVFVTDNTKDFASNDSRTVSLHYDLREDMSARQMSGDSICLVTSLQSLLDKYVKPLLERIEILEQIASDDVILGQFDSFFESYFDQILMRFQELVNECAEELSTMFGIQIEEPFIASADLPGTLRSYENHALGHERVLVTLSTRSELELEFVVDKSEAIGLPADSKISVFDYDWNKTYARAGRTVEFDLDFELVSNGDESLVTDWNLTFAQPVWPEE